MWVRIRITKRQLSTLSKDLRQNFFLNIKGAILGKWIYLIAVYKMFIYFKYVEFCFFTKWIKHPAEYVSFCHLGRLYSREAALDRESFRAPFGQELVDHFLLKCLCDGKSSVFNFWIGQKVSRLISCLWIRWLMQLEGTFEDSKCQNQKEGGTMNFEIELLRRFLKKNSCWDGPKGLLNPTSLGNRRSAIHPSRKIFFSMFFLSWLKPKIEKRTVLYAGNALWAPRNRERWNVTTGLGYEPWLCYYQLGFRDTWHNLWAFVSLPVRLKWQQIPQSVVRI